MPIKKISIHRVFNLGNYDNEKIGLEYELEEDEDIQDVIETCQAFIWENSTEKKREDEKVEKEYENHLSVLRDAQQYPTYRIKQAYEFIAKYDGISLDEVKQNYGIPSAIMDLITLKDQSKTSLPDTYQDQNEDLAF